MKRYIVTLDIVAHDGQMTDIPDIDWAEVLRLDYDEHVEMVRCDESDYDEEEG